MGKRGKLLIWCVMVLLGVNTITMSGKAAESDGFKYSMYISSRGETLVEITGYIGSDTTVTIPKTLNGRRVTHIRRYAFSGCSSLECITVDDANPKY